jgi:dTDP-4-dehydrorhamnose reductase
MKILVFGKDGQLGQAFQKALKTIDTVFIGRKECDLSNSHAVLEHLHQINPDCVINAAAYTAVDKAEEEKERAFAVNTLALKTMAEYCAANQKVLVHYSTDYVFDGEKTSSYVETDLCKPLSVYGKSKYAGELAILEAFRSHSDSGAKQSSHFYILRTSWVYGDGSNFIRTILRLAKERSSLNVVADQLGVPTNTDWLVKITMNLLSDYATPSGIYHAVPAGQTSWYGVACFVIECAKSLGLILTLDPEQIKPIPTNEYPLPAKRPMNSSLSTQKLMQVAPGCTELLTEDWKVGVGYYLTDLKDRGLI